MNRFEDDLRMNYLCWTPSRRLAYRFHSGLRSDRSRATILSNWHRIWVVCRPTWNRLIWNRTKKRTRRTTTHSCIRDPYSTSRDSWPRMSKKLKRLLLLYFRFSLFFHVLRILYKKWCVYCVVCLVWMTMTLSQPRDEWLVRLTLQMSYWWQNSSTRVCS